MSGNVWEWQNAGYDTRQMHRAMRGGAWNDPRSGVRGASRAGGLPDDWSLDFGFRVVSPVDLSGGRTKSLDKQAF